MSSFCLVKNSTTDNFIKSVGEKQAAIIAETINRNEDVYIRNLEGKLVKSVLFSNLLKDSNNNHILAFEKYIDIYNATDIEKDFNGEPLYEPLSFSEVVDTETISNTQYKVLSNTINNFHLRLLKNPSDQALKDTIKRYPKMDFNALDDYEKARAIRVTIDYIKTSADKLRDELYGDNGYNDKNRLDSVINNRDEEVKLTSILNHANSFFKGLVTFDKLEIPIISNPTESEKVLIDNIKELKRVVAEANNMKATTKRLTTTFFDKVLTNISTNPDIKLGFRSIFDMQDDETSIQLMLDSLADTHHTFAANFIKRFIIMRGRLKTAAEDKVRGFDEVMDRLEKKGFKFEDILEKDNSGKYTGRLISEFHNEYMDIHKEYYNKMSDAEKTYGKYTNEYYEAEKAYITWKLNNILHKQKDEVIAERSTINDILYRNFDARKALSEIDDKIHRVLNSYDKTYSIFDLSENDQLLLNQYNEERKQLPLLTDKKGNKKTGVELNIANTLREYNDRLSKHHEKYYETVTNDNFESKLKEHVNNNSDESKSWIKRNTKKLLNKLFWDTFDINNSILNPLKVKSETSDMLKPYRMEDGEIDGNNVPKEILDKVREEHKNRFKDTDIKEDKIPKGIIKPKNDDVYIEDYYARFSKMGYSSLDDNEIIINANKKINNILQNYVNKDGIVDYSAISNDDLIAINEEFDRIDFISMQYSYDKARFEFREWMVDNHDFITDTEAFNRAYEIAKSKGKEYEQNWLYANTSFGYTEAFYNKVDELRNLYMISNRKKAKTNVLRLNYDLLRSRFPVSSYAELPAKIQNLIAKEHRTDSYTLTNRIRDKRLTLQDAMASDSVILEKLKTGLAAGYQKRITDENKQTTNHYLKYEDDYNALFDKTTVPEYYELLKEHGTESKWYYDNHTINSKGEIEPVAFWVISKPKDSSYYNENTPKSKIWGYSKLNNDTYIDKAKSVSKKWINDNVSYETTEQYDNTIIKNKATLSPIEYTRWFNDNHVYNPISNKFEPIAIWTKITSYSDQYVDNVAPKKHLTTTKIKDEYSNESGIGTDLTDPYRDVFGYALPKKSSSFYNKDFDKIKDNELYKYVKGLLGELTEHYSKDTLIDAGWLPIVKKADTKKPLDKLLKSVGWYAYNSNEVVGENNEGIKIFNLPFVEKLTTQSLLTVPVKKEDQDLDKFQLEYDEVIAKNKEIKRINDEYNQSVLDTDYKNVLRLFITASMNHKFVTEQEHEMKLGLEELRGLDYFRRKSALNRTRRKNKTLEDQEGVDDIETFAKADGTPNVATHLEKFIEMIFYGNFEKDEGNWTKIARVLQNWTSAKGMWFNTAGAFNNVAYGKSQIAIERYSGYFFNNADRLKAEKDYALNSINFFRDTTSDKATSLISGLVKRFNVVQMQDEQPLTNNPELNNTIKKHLLSSNTMYILHHIGEHYMQNVVLLSMLYSNRIINGQIKSLQEYTFDLRYKALYAALGDNGKARLDSFVEFNKYKDKYLDGRSDMIRDFILSANSDVQISFLNTLDEYKKQAIKEFETFDRAIDVFELKDGRAVVKEGINVDNDSIVLFESKVIKVNQKINGIYNKFDAGTVQNTGIGRLAMQFRKWMRPGWNRRFGARFGKNSWNEQRNELDNGNYITFLRFLTKPITDNLNHEQFKDNPDLTVIEAFGNIIKDYGTYMKNVSLYWHSLSDSEKAGVKRTLVEMSYFVGTVLLFGLLKGLGDDDELEDTKLYAYSLYSLDRLKSELRAYEPIFGWFNESRKLMKDPFAAMGTVDDALKLAYTALFENDEAYKNGMYHGKDKLDIQLLKNIPLFNRYLRYNNIQAYAGYYKLYGY